MTDLDGSDVVVALKGGLGNQLFQWAFGEGLVERGAQVRYDTGLFGEGIAFELAPILSDARLVTTPTAIRRARRRLHLPTALSPWRDVAEPGFRYVDPARLGLRGRVLAEGYWQSPRYFGAAEQRIRTTVSAWAARSLTDEGRALRAEIDATAGACSVHVRRGDYLDPTVSVVHGVLDVDYYRRAMDAARSHGARRFYVFSNDPAWVASELSGADVVAVPWSVGEGPVAEIGLMSACAIHVVANSSFSWWGAWLGGANDPTVAPRDWFASADLDVRDLLPEDWERIPNSVD